MDFDELSKALIELKHRNDEWNLPIMQVEKEGWVKVREGAMTKDEAEYQTYLVYLQQLKIRNPRQEMFPLREALLHLYEHTTDKERKNVAKYEILYTNSHMFHGCYLITYTIARSALKHPKIVGY